MRAERGVALITVLLVVALVTVVCASMIARQQLSIRATGNQLQVRQAWHYALGGEALAQSSCVATRKRPELARNRQWITWAKLGRGHNPSMIWMTARGKSSCASRI